MKYDCENIDNFVVGIISEDFKWFLNETKNGRGISMNGFKGRCN